MIKLLLADDNPVVLRYFSTLLEWESLGYELIGTAIDGEEAWAIFEKEHPQVILTDIQMPNMTGIELSEKVLAERPSTVILFLSSYEEFQYAQAALHLGISDYMLKHETTAESLSEKLLSIRKKLQGDQRDLLYIEQGRFLYMLRHPFDRADPHCLEIISSWSGVCRLLLLVQNHFLPCLEKFTPLSCPEIGEAALEPILSALPGHCSHSRLAPYTYALLFEEEIGAGKNEGRGQAKSEEKTSNPWKSKNAPREGTPGDIPQQLSLALSRAFPQTFSVLEVQKSGPCRTCFDQEEALLALSRQLFFFPPSSVISREWLPIPSPGISLNPEEFRSLASAHSWEEARLLLKENLTGALLRQDLSSFLALAEPALEVLFSQSQALFSRSGQEAAPALEDSLSWYDAPALTRWILDQFQKLQEFYGTATRESYSALVNEILVYIHENYADSDFGVEALADHFSLNLNQLNYMLKKETGHSPIHWLTQARMDRACQLLSDLSLSIGEVCAQSGYKSSSYFSSVFKKNRGMTPQEYRREKR